MFGCVKVPFCIRGVRVVSESGGNDISADGAFDGFGFGGFGAVGRVGSDVNFCAARAVVPVSCAVFLPGRLGCGVQLEVGPYRHIGCGHGKVGFGCGAIRKGAFSRLGPVFEVIACGRGNRREMDGLPCLFKEVFRTGALLDRHSGIDVHHLDGILFAVAVGYRFYREGRSGFVRRNGENAVA